MREIKFRGKRLDNGEWVYGSLVAMNDGVGIAPQSYHSVAISKKHGLHGLVEVDSATVGLNCVPMITLKSSATSTKTRN